MIKRRIAVLRGGPSSEHDVSLKTGRSVLEELRDEHNLIDIVVDRRGVWHRDGIERSPKEALNGVEVVFNAMHGEYGEDGKVQQLLDQLQVPYSGAKALASALTMNKEKTKEIYKQHGIKTPIHKVLSKPETEEGLDFQAMLVFRNFTMPVVMKPIDKGSSVGVSLARDFETLKTTMRSLYEYSDKIMFEEYIQGKEATVGVVEGLRGERHYSLTPVEIRVPKQAQLFDYRLKYGEDPKEGLHEAAEIVLSAEKLCPGNFTQVESQTLQDLAKKAHQILDLRHYSRTDFILHPRRGIYALETNSLPGLTKESLLPRSLEAHDIKYKDFLLHVLNLI